MARFPPDVEKQIEEYQSELVLQSSDLSLNAIAQMVDANAIDISPTFQRRDRWKPGAQSRLIESFLLNMPVPPVYLSEDQNGTYAVLDGKQRITAIHLFMSNRLTLTGLDILHDLNGRSIRDFPSSITNPLAIRPYVRAVTLLRQSEHRARYEVFLRLNIAGVPLLPMEVRKVAFRGGYCDMIFEEAESPFLKSQLKIRSDQSSAYRKMIDAEYVLRFLALRQTWDKFSGDLRETMDRHMQEHVASPPGLVNSHRAAFRRAISYCERIWGEQAFQRPDGPGWRNQALAGVYDAEMIAVDSLSDKELERICRQRARAVELTRVLFKSNEQFLEFSTVATNTPARIVYRIEQMQDLLHSLG